MKVVVNGLKSGLMSLLMAAIFCFPNMLLWNLFYADLAGFPKATLPQVFTVIFLIYMQSNRFSYQPDPEKP